MSSSTSEIGPDARRVGRFVTATLAILVVTVLIVPVVLVFAVTIWESLALIVLS